jgi:hypothetical protein
MKIKTTLKTVRHTKSSSKEEAYSENSSIKKYLNKRMTVDPALSPYVKFN